MRSEQLNVSGETRVIAVAMAPDPVLQSRDCVRRWISESERRGQMVRNHPALTRVVGLAVARLEVSESSVRLADINARVGDEQDALGLLGDSFGTGGGQVIAYMSEAGGFEPLWLRMLLGGAIRRGPQMAEHWKWRDLANTFSIDGLLPVVPLQVAAASKGIAADGLLSTAERERGCTTGEWRKVAHDLIGSLNVVAALYCALVGLEVDAFECATVKGL